MSKAALPNFLTLETLLETFIYSEKILFLILLAPLGPPVTSNASLILEDIFASLKSNQSISSQIPKLVEETKTQNEFENIMLADLLLSVRAYNALKRANVHNLSELLKYSKEDLLEFKNFGQKSADEVCESLQKHFGIVLNTSD